MSRTSLRGFAPRLCAVGGLALAACGGGEEAGIGAAEGSATAVESSSAAAEAGRSAAEAGFNRAPEVVSARFEPENPSSGEPVKVVSETRDLDGDRVTLSYRWTLDGRPVAGGGERIDLRGFEKGDTVEVEITPSDEDSSGDVYRLSTRIRNRPPVVHSVRIDPSDAVQIGTDLRAVVNARDHDRDALRLEIEWYANGRQVGEGETFETEGLPKASKIHVEVTAHDGQDRSETVSSDPVAMGNTPPQIISFPSTPGPDGVFRYQVRAADPDGDRGIVFRLAQAPAGMTIDRTGGQVYWEPRADQEGTFPVAIVADDRKGGLARQEFELTVGGSPAAPAP